MSGSKFAGVLGKIREAPRREVEAPSPPLPVAPRPTGRPPGKRSDPDWSPRTILMNRHTHKSTTRVLLDTDDERDLSELVDELLNAWLNRA